MSRILLVLVLLAAASCGKHEHHVAPQVHEERAAPITSPAPPTATPRASRSAVRPPVAPTSSVWDRLADCESSPTGWDRYGRPIPGSADWHLNDGSGYYGGLQFVASTWAGFGGLAYAPRADLATREQQIIVARRVLAPQGWTAWPVCSRKIGMR